MSQFEIVLIAALTSAGVALAIEWAAKPRLEARKDRILEQSKARREIDLQLSIIVGLSGSLITDISDLDKSERKIMLSLLEDSRKEIITASKAVESALAVVDDKIDAQVSKVIHRALGAIKGLTLVGELGIEDTGLTLAVVSGRALDMYRTHWWQVRKRRKLAAAAESFMSLMNSID